MMMMITLLLSAPVVPALLIQSAGEESERRAAGLPILSALFPQQGDAFQLQPSATPFRAKSDAITGTQRVPMKPQIVNLRNREYNNRYKSEMNTRIRNVKEAVEERNYNPEDMGVDDWLARTGSPVMMAEDAATPETALGAAEDTVRLLSALRQSFYMPMSHTILPARIPQDIAVTPIARTFASRVRASPVMSAVVDEVMEKLKSMTLLEARDLVKAIEETFDVDASAGGGGMMMMPPGAGGVPAGGDAPAAEEKTEFDLVLDSFPADKKIAVLKIVRELTGLGLKDAKTKVESAPCTLKEGSSKAECDEAKAKLEEVGAKVELK